MRTNDEENNELKPGYWAVIPAPIRYSTELPPGAKLLYAEISSLIKERGYCYASNAYFEKRYGISEPTIQRYLRALKKQGFIRIADCAGGKDLRKIYADVNPFSETPVKNDGGPPSEMTPPPIKNDTQNKKENKKEEQDPPKPPRGRRESKSTPKHEPEMFDRFWKAYPRGEDKQGAAREWDRLQPDLQLMRIMSAALEAQKLTLTADDPHDRYPFPYAVRWIKYRRWEDELAKIRALRDQVRAENAARTVEVPEEVPRW